GLRDRDPVTAPRAALAAANRWKRQASVRQAPFGLAKSPNALPKMSVARSGRSYRRFLPCPDGAPAVRARSGGPGRGSSLLVPSPPLQLARERLLRHRRPRGGGVTPSPYPLQKQRQDYGPRKIVVLLLPSGVSTRAK